MRKTFIAVLLFLLIPLLSETIQAQIPVNTTYYGAGSIKYLSKTSNFDSTSTLYSEWFDITHLDGQTMYGIYDIVAPVATDTFRIIVQSAFPGTEATASTFLELDTQTVQSTTTSGARFFTYSFTSFAPMVRFKIIPGNALTYVTRIPTAFRWAVYTKVEDYVPTAQQYSNVKP